MNYEKHLREHRRLVILRVLAEVPGKTANCSILQDMVEAWGNTSTRDQIKSEIMWLHEQGLVKRSEKASIVIAQITQRGHDVAKGRSMADGVAEPLLKD